MGTWEEEGVWRFLKQVDMETQGGVGVFNYPQIQGNFLLFLTTPPTARLMGVLNKRRGDRDCLTAGWWGGAVGGRFSSVCLVQPFSVTLQLLLELSVFLQWGRNFKAHLNFCVDVDKSLPESKRYSYAA